MSSQVDKDPKIVKLVMIKHEIADLAIKNSCVQVWRMSRILTEQKWRELNDQALHMKNASAIENTHNQYKPK